MSFPLKILSILLWIFSTPMRNATIYIQRKFGGQKSNLSVDQLSHALSLTSEEDTTKEEQKNSQRNCFFWKYRYETGYETSSRYFCTG